MKIQARIHIRWFILRDIAEVMAIESRSFADSCDEQFFENQLRRRNVICMVGEGIDGHVISYVVYELHRRHVEILKLAVHRDYRREGIGTVIIDRLKSKLCEQRRNRLSTLVGERSLDAQLFFRACGFIASGIDGVTFFDQEAYRFDFRYGW